MQLGHAYIGSQDGLHIGLPKTLHLVSIHKFECYVSTVYYKDELDHLVSLTTTKRKLNEGLRTTFTFINQSPSSGNACYLKS